MTMQASEALRWAGTAPLLPGLVETKPRERLGIDLTAWRRCLQVMGELGAAGEERIAVGGHSCKAAWTI